MVAAVAEMLAEFGALDVAEGESASASLARLEELPEQFDSGPISVESSHLASVGWSGDDPLSGTLTIEFTNDGSSWAYDGVSLSMFTGLLRAGSKGRFFAEFIRDSYPSEQVG